MKKKSTIFALLLAAGVQTATAQKIIVTKVNSQVVEFDVSEVEHITFEEEVPMGEHKWVDLGLPSGTLWAACNMGAGSPEEYGNYFAWGETQPKDNYTWGTYTFCKGSNDNMTRYCTYGGYGYNGFVDNTITLRKGDDASTKAWGNSWYIPTKEQFEELINSEYTTTTWTTENGVNGWEITSKNRRRSIFLPAAGYRDEASLSYPGEMGYYWSSSLSMIDYSANVLLFYSGGIFTGSSDRYHGLPIRPVRDKHEAVDLGLPSGTLWATMNVGADSPEGYGDYFAWGETTPKDNYRWNTYQYCSYQSGDKYEFTKYCTNSDYGKDGVTDGLTELLQGDDAASANWGGVWQMPSAEQFEELIENTTQSTTTLNGVKGNLFTGSNGESIFLPFGDCRESTSNPVIGNSGYYWSRSLNTELNYHAHYLSFYKNNVDISTHTRETGYSVRPVRRQ